MGSRGQYRTVKNYVIDLPLSQSSFQNYFHLDYNGEISIKMSVPVNHLDRVFGVNWHILQFENSCTRKRIIGLVIMHYRKKTAPKAVIASCAG